MSGEVEFRWWREGGFRWPWLARRTNGRCGLGRWTQAEVDAIRTAAAANYALFAFYADTSPAEPHARIADTAEQEEA